MKAWYAYHALMNLDSNCENYINKYAQQPGTSSGLGNRFSSQDDTEKCN